MPRWLINDDNIDCYLDGTHTKMPDLTPPIESGRMGLPVSSSMIGKIFAAHRRHAILMKSVLLARWRPTQILVSNCIGQPR